MNRFWRWLAWKLPNRLVYWCGIRVVANATTGRYQTTIVPELSAMDALDRWDLQNCGHRRDKGFYAWARRMRSRS